VVLRLLRGEPVEALSRELGVEVYRPEEWKAKALAGMEASLREPCGDPLERDLDVARKKIGELSMENELLRTRSRGGGPLRQGETAELSATISPATGRAYGVERGCQVWE
jgi:hypothetical protein